MEDEKTDELKNKISELKHRLNQLYAQYFSDTREGRVFESEFSLYMKAAESARREKTQLIKLQFATVQIGMIVLIAFAALTMVLFRQQIFFSAFFLLGLGFFACGFLYLLVLADIKIARADRFCSDLGSYFRQHRWGTEIKKNLRLPDIPLWEEYGSQSPQTDPRSRRCERHALYTPLRIAISFIDLLVLAMLIQTWLSGNPVISRTIMICYLILWFGTTALHMLLVDALTARAETTHDQEMTRRTYLDKITNIPSELMKIPRLFLLLDILFPKAQGSGINRASSDGKTFQP